MESHYEVEFELWRVAHREKALLAAWNYDEDDDPDADYVRARPMETVPVSPEYL